MSSDFTFLSIDKNPSEQSVFFIKSTPKDPSLFSFRNPTCYHSCKKKKIAQGEANVHLGKMLISQVLNMPRNPKRQNSMNASLSITIRKNRKLYKKKNAI